jgi:hypothetical protein
MSEHDIEVEPDDETAAEPVAVDLLPIRESDVAIVDLAEPHPGTIEIG